MLKWVSLSFLSWSWLSWKLCQNPTAGRIRLRRAAPFLQQTHSCTNTRTKTPFHSKHRHSRVTALTTCFEYVHLQLLEQPACLPSVWLQRTFASDCGSSLNASWPRASKSATGNINTYHPIRLNGGDVSCWAGLQPLTPALFPLLMSLSLSAAAPSIFLRAVSPVAVHSQYFTQGHPSCLPVTRHFLPLL